MINLSFVLILLVLMTMADTVIFCIKGSYPVEIYLPFVPTCITALVLIYKLKINMRLSTLEKICKYLKCQPEDILSIK